MDALDRLLVAIARRHGLAVAARAATHAGGLLAAATAFGGFLARQAGWELPAWPLFVPIVGASAWGFWRHRPLTATAAARLADRGAGGDDLLLTAVQANAGAWLAIVRIRAVAMAANLDPARLRPWRPWPEAALAGAAAVLLAAGWWLPPLGDPFGWRERRSTLARQEAAMAAQRSLARTQAARLRTDGPPTLLSAAAADSIDRLLLALAAPSASAATALAEAQDALERAWAATPPSGPTSSLGADNGARHLQEALAHGDAAPATAAIAVARDAAGRLAADGGAGSLHHELERLADAVAGSAAEPGLRAALDHLARCAEPALAQTAREALAEQLEVSALELQALAQQRRDATALREALRTLTLARRLDGLGARPSDPSPSLAEYHRRYEEALARRTAATGGGDDGADLPWRTSDSLPGQTAADPERSPTALGAGRLLMDRTAPGSGERGTVHEDYRHAADTVRQAVAAALERERLPPGQEAAVRRYFTDALP